MSSNIVVVLAVLVGFVAGFMARGMFGGSSAPVLPRQMLLPEDRAGLERQALELVRGGNTIHAIKLWREATGAGLKEAKEAVEDLERRGPGPQSIV